MVQPLYMPLLSKISSDVLKKGFNPAYDWLSDFSIQLWLDRYVEPNKDVWYGSIQRQNQFLAHINS